MIAPLRSHGGRSCSTRAVRLCAWLSGILCLVCACDAEEDTVHATRIFLRVQASVEVRDAGKTLTFSVAREEAGGSWHAGSTSEVEFARIARWPVDIPVDPEGREDGTRALEFVVRAFDEAGDLLAEARAITEYALREQVVLQIVLATCSDGALAESCESRVDCHGSACLTCSAGACTATPFIRAADLARFDVDAAILDEGRTLGGPASTSSESDLDAGVDAADEADAVEAGAEPQQPQEDCAAGQASCSDASTDLKTLAVACDAPEECESGYCVDGTCCDRSCDDPCESCAVQSSPGTCRAIDFTASNLTDNCGACGVFCSARNIVPQCTAGVCDGACALGFDDCNRDKQRDGCETDIKTPQDCGSCGTACVYGYCAGVACEWTLSGSNAATGSSPLAAGELRGSWLIFDGTDRLVKALGALVDPALPGASLRLALYREDSQGVPSELVVETDQLPTLDNSRSLVMGKNMLRVEGNVRPTQLDPEAFYWLFVAVTQTTRISAYVAGGVTEWRTAAGDAAQSYPERLPPSSVHDAPVLDLYAITTAQ